MPTALQLQNRLPDDAFRAAMLEACQAILSTGQYPSYLALRARGICGSNSRIIRVRDSILPELGITPERHKPKLRGLAAQRAYAMGWQRKPLPERPKAKPKQSTPPPSGGAAACWELRKAFWATTTGKRTRALLRPSTTEVQS